jgi:prepilin-type N-terminal cleavage/methylation domain-containing protein
LSAARPGSGPAAGPGAGRLPRRRRAFTLLEMTLVMALIVILASLSYPAIGAMYAETRLQAGSDAVRAAWAEAQGHAVEEGRAYRFAIVPGKGNYRVAPDASEFWSGDGAAYDPENPSYILEDSLPKGMMFPDSGGRPMDVLVDDYSDTPADKEKVGTGQWVTYATFLPDGTSVEDVDLPLEYTGCRPLTLHLRSLTGTVTVQRGD